MRKRITAVSLALILLLCACGRPVQEKETADIPGQGIAVLEQQEWDVKEISLPDADEALADLLAGNDDGQMELLYDVAGTDIYRVVWAYGQGMETGGICIQKLEAPYLTWKNTVISADSWLEGAYCYVRKAVLRQDGSICMLLQGIHADGTQSYYRALWSEKDGCTAEKLPDDCPGEELLAGSGVFYADMQDAFYLAMDTKLYYFDGRDAGKRELEASGYIWQVTAAPNSDEQVYLCVNLDGGGFCIQTISGKTVYKTEEAAGAVTGRVVFSKEGEGFLCTTEGVWQFRTADGQMEKMTSFTEEGYILDKVCAAGVSQDGALLIAAVSGGEPLLLRYGGRQETENQGQEPSDKIELELAATYPSAFLKQAIIAFNRQSNEYHIVLREPADGESRLDFQTRLQAEISGGGGPALLSDDVMDLKSAVEKEVLRDLTEDFAALEGDIAANARLLGQMDEGRYAVPYSFSVNTFVTSMNVVGEKASWTPEEMMQCVRESGAKAAVSNLDGARLFDILVSRGDLIDWENKRCELDSKEAVLRLEFANEYGDDGQGEEMGIRVAKGEVLSLYMSLSGLMFVQGMEAVFEGQAAYIGLPVENGGNGNIMVGDTLSVNRACEHPEGAVEFIVYLLGEEMQEKLAKDACGHGVSGFPVTSKGLESMFCSLEELIEDEDILESPANFMGYDYTERPLSKESIEKIRKLLQCAEPQMHQTDEISAVILEETPAYFSGGKPAGEVCGILQSRIQLYLDEMN